MARDGAVEHHPGEIESAGQTRDRPEPPTPTGPGRDQRPPVPGSWGVHPDVLPVRIEAEGSLTPADVQLTRNCEVSVIHGAVI